MNISNYFLAWSYLTVCLYSNLVFINIVVKDSLKSETEIFPYLFVNSAVEILIQINSLLIFVTVLIRIPLGEQMGSWLTHTGLRPQPSRWLQSSQPPTQSQYNLSPHKLPWDLASIGGDSDIGQKHLEITKEPRLKQHKIPSCLVQEDGNLVDPIRNNSLLLYFSIQFL